MALKWGKFPPSSAPSLVSMSEATHGVGQMAHGPCVWVVPCEALGSSLQDAAIPALPRKACPQVAYPPLPEQALSIPETGEKR